ncbi:hypothetical protein D9615_008575 [Tricholomella constricta]|uniref:HMG box domain-containing protein n=1 Tax=Tricholomella constricta TaxID=117010 RepID=A0A8H5H4G0_9AGAR|nr:hypothetical protein D9615_008575 [Tricholomella constricta]
MPAAPKLKSTSDRVPRPPNSFMLYRADQLTDLPPLPPGRSNAWTPLEISCIISGRWNSATYEVKAYWKERADAAKEAHAQLHPSHPTRKEDKPKRKPRAQKATRSSSSQLSGSTTSLSPPALAVYGEPMSAFAPFEDQPNGTEAAHAYNQAELPLPQPEVAGQAGAVAFNGTAQPEGLNSNLENQYYVDQWAYHYFGQNPNFNGDPTVYANDRQLVQEPTGPLNVEIGHIPDFNAQASLIPNAEGHGVQAEYDPYSGGLLGQGGVDAGASEAISLSQQSMAPPPMGDELVQEPTGPLNVEIGHVPDFNAQASIFPNAEGYGVQAEHDPSFGGLLGQDGVDTGATEAGALLQQSMAPPPVADELVQEPTGPLDVEIGHTYAQASVFPNAEGYGVQAEYDPYSGRLCGQDLVDSGATEAGALLQQSMAPPPVGDELVQEPTGPLDVEIGHTHPQASVFPSAEGYGVQAEYDPSFGGLLGQDGVDAQTREAILLLQQLMAPLPTGDELVQEPTGPLHVEIGHIPDYDTQAFLFPNAAGYGVRAEYNPYSSGLWGQDFGNTGATEAGSLMTPLDMGDVDAAYPNQMLEGFWDFHAPLDYNFSAAQLAE